MAILFPTTPCRWLLPQEPSCIQHLQPVLLMCCTGIMVAPWLMLANSSELFTYACVVTNLLDLLGSFEAYQQSLPIRSQSPHVLHSLCAKSGTVMSTAKPMLTFKRSSAPAASAAEPERTDCTAASRPACCSRWAAASRACPAEPSLALLAPLVPAAAAAGLAGGLDFAPFGAFPEACTCQQITVGLDWFETRCSALTCQLPHDWQANSWQVCALSTTLFEACTVSAS